MPAPIADDFASHLWNTHWHLVAHRSELITPRDFVRFDVLGQEVVLFNDGASVIAFDNRCPHRGARIFDEDYGRKRFVCAYHGWSYSKGRIVVADRQSFAHCPLDALSLNAFAVEWLGDFAFVSPAPKQTLQDQLGDLAPLLERISLGVGARWDFSRYVYEADWRIALENALEPYHVSGIHPNTLGTLKLAAGENHYFGRNSIWSAPVDDLRMAKRLTSLSRLFDLPHQYHGYQSIYLFPFTMISSTFGFSQSLQHFLPTGQSERTHFTSRLLTGRLAPGVNPALVEPLMQSTATMNRAVFEEDHEICQRVPVDAWSSAPPRFWSTSEEKLLHFRRSYRELMAEAAEAL